VVKKHLTIALISCVLLIAIFYFTGEIGFSGYSISQIPDQNSLFDIEENSIQDNFFIYDSEVEFSGEFSFNVIEGDYLPVNFTYRDGSTVITYVVLEIYNKTSNNEFDYHTSKAMRFKAFMGNITPEIGDPVEYIYESSTTGSSIAQISGGVTFSWEGVPSFPSVSYIYNTSDPDVLGNNPYTVDLEIFDLNLPSDEGSYEYALNLTLGNGGPDESMTNFKILEGSFNVLDGSVISNDAEVNFSVLNGGEEFNKGNKLNCSFDFGYSPSIDEFSDNLINFSIGWYDDGFLHYKNFFYDDANCNDNICEVVFSVDESHTGNWSCIVNIGEGEIIKKSNNLTMLNSPPELIDAIPNLTFAGGFEEDFIDLSDYFEDPDGDSLEYTYTGGDKINLSINSNGKVNITAPDDINLSEGFRFVASDGVDSVESNLFNITIIGLTEESNDTCVPDWETSNWGECNPGGVRYRNVTDLNGCGVDTDKPAMSESCTYQGGEPLAGDETEGSETETQPEKKEESIFENKLFLTGIILGLFLLLLVGILLFEKLKSKKGFLEEDRKEKPKKKEKKEKPKEETQVKTKIKAKKIQGESIPVNIEDAVKYVKDMKERGASLKDIKNKLILSGWEGKHANQAIDILRLREFINEKLKQGAKKESLVKLLKQKGWKEEIIDKAFKNTEQ